MKINKDKLKKQIIEFAVKGVEKFLNENPNLKFYALAFDCNAEYAGIGLCLNTEESFQNTLKHYQTGDSAKYYQKAEDIKDLKYNTGDWEYQCFENLDVFDENELQKIFDEMPDDDYQSWNNFVNDLLELFTESLVEFSKTETFTKIPKTDNFIVYCIDHDEDFDDAMERL
ncbi:MAG: DUF4303 domain-containing protein [Prevotellaceae bacterium]|jgi:hypothetical protein|nr:DUF4303 domain-containing protein [Prevotellaceae bacterium]